MSTIDALSVDSERKDEKAQFENSFYNIIDGERVSASKRLSVVNRATGKQLAAVLEVNRVLLNKAIICLFIIEVMLQRLKKERIRAGLFAILFNASCVFLISSSLLVAWCAFNSCDFK